MGIRSALRTHQHLEGLCSISRFQARRYGHREELFSHGYNNGYCCFPGSTGCVRGSPPPIRMQVADCRVEIRSRITKRKVARKLSVFGETESEVRGRVVGTWKLVSAEETLKGGGTRPFPQFGPHGKGFLMYQANGYMCVVIENPNRSKPDDRVRTTLDENVAAADGIFAYCGRYEIDVERKQIVHLPEISTAHGYVGSRQVRPCQFEGERLIFSDVEKGDAEVSSWKIVWERAH